MHFLLACTLLKLTHGLISMCPTVQVDEEFLEVAGKHGWKGNRDSRLVPGGNLIISAKR